MRFEVNGNLEDMDIQELSRLGLRAVKVLGDGVGWISSSLGTCVNEADYRREFDAVLKVSDSRKRRWIEILVNTLLDDLDLQGYEVYTNGERRWAIIIDGCTVPG